MAQTAYHISLGSSIPITGPTSGEFKLLFDERFNLNTHIERGMIFLKNLWIQGVQGTDLSLYVITMESDGQTMHALSHVTPSQGGWLRDNSITLGSQMKNQLIDMGDLLVSRDMNGDHFRVQVHQYIPHTATDPGTTNFVGMNFIVQSEHRDPMVVEFNRNYTY